MTLPCVNDLTFLEPPALVFTLPLAPQGDGSTVVSVAMVGEVNIHSRMPIGDVDSGNK